MTAKNKAFAVVMLGVSGCVNSPHTDPCICPDPFVIYEVQQPAAVEKKINKENKRDLTKVQKNLQDLSTKLKPEGQ